MHPSADCVERRTLWEQYHAALRAYVDATHVLDTLEVGNGFDHDYNVATWARLEFERVRDEYKQHLQKHGCA